jgi:UDP-glucose 4-epimerase
MRIFITGGAGYIGSARAEVLLNQGHEVTVYDSLISGHRSAVPSEAHFIKADLADNYTLSQSLTENRMMRLCILPLLLKLVKA